MLYEVITEPEGLDTDEIYASGLGNSLPLEIQIEVVHSVKGLGAAEIMRPAYAIEYDVITSYSIHYTKLYDICPHADIGSKSPKYDIH